MRKRGRTDHKKNVSRLRNWGEGTGGEGINAGRGEKKAIQGAEREIRNDFGEVLERNGKREEGICGGDLSPSIGRRANDKKGEATEKNVLVALGSKESEGRTVEGGRLNAQGLFWIIRS